VDAALARLRVSEAQRYPQLSFSANLSTNGSRASDWLSQPLLSLAGNLVVPLIDWQRLDAQRDSARTELELAALQLRDTVARSVVEVEALLVEGQRLRDQQAANVARLREATQAARQAALRYETGTLSRADWLQLEVARLDAEISAQQLLLRERVQREQLARALAL
jgi:outer membrane protein TolC